MSRHCWRGCWRVRLAIPIPRLPLVGDPLRRIRVPHDLGSVTTRAIEETDVRALGMTAEGIERIWAGVERLYRGGRLGRPRARAVGRADDQREAHPAPGPGRPVAAHSHDRSGGAQGGAHGHLVHRVMRQAWISIYGNRRCLCERLRYSVCMHPIPGAIDSSRLDWAQDRAFETHRSLQIRSLPPLSSELLRITRPTRWA